MSVVGGRRGRPRGEHLPLHGLRRSSKPCWLRRRRDEVRPVRRLAPAPPPVGVSVPRRDGVAKVTAPRGSRSTSACRAWLTPNPAQPVSPRPDQVARRRPGARNLPGVVAVVSAADLRRPLAALRTCRRGPSADRRRVVRFAGEPVVGVVADDELVRRRRRSRDRGRLRAAAVRDRSPRGAGRRTPRSSTATTEHRGRESNDLLTERVTPRLGRHPRPGSMPRPLVVEGEYDYPMAYAYAMEPYTALASLAGGRAHRLELRPASVHGPRRPVPGLRPAARLRSGSSSRTSAAATAASRTRRSSR